MAMPKPNLGQSSNSTAGVDQAQWTIKGGHGRPHVITGEVLALTERLMPASERLGSLRQAFAEAPAGDDLEQSDLQDALFTVLEEGGYSVHNTREDLCGDFVITRAKDGGNAERQTAATTMGVGGEAALVADPDAGLGFTIRTPLALVEDAGSPKSVLIHYTVADRAPLKDTPLGREIADGLRAISNLGPDTLPDHLPLLQKLLTHPEIAGTPEGEQIQNTIDSYFPDGHWIAHGVMFPGAHRFGDLFSEVEPRAAESKSEVIGRLGDEPWATEITDLILVGRLGSGGGICRVVPQPGLVEGLREKMLNVEYDSIHFTTHYHKESDHVLVVAQHSQIIGSRYLAYVPASTCPNLSNGSFRATE